MRNVEENEARQNQMGRVGRTKVLQIVVVYWEREIRDVQHEERNGGHVLEDLRVLPNVALGHQ